MTILILAAVLIMVYDFGYCAINPNVYVNEINQRMYSKHKFLLASIPDAIYVGVIVYLTPAPQETPLLIVHIFIHNSLYHLIGMYVIAVASYIIIAGTSMKHAITNGMILIGSFLAGYFLVGLIISVIYLIFVGSDSIIV